MSVCPGDAPVAGPLGHHTDDRYSGSPPGCRSRAGHHVAGGPRSSSPSGVAPKGAGRNRCSCRRNRHSGRCRRSRVDGPGGHSSDGHGPVPATPVVAKKKRLVPVAPPRETALSTDPEPTLTAETFFATAKASEHYAAIADAGGWPEIAGPVSGGSAGKAISTLRLRLAIEGDLGKAEGGDPADLTAGMFSQKWGADLTAAVKRFQARHGLKESGVVAGATLKALNVTARTRFTELASSAQRLAGRNFSFAERYVVVNIPSASVEAVENGRVEHRYVAVVGGPDHASPEVDAKVQAINLNPTWTVPTSIIKNEIIPKMQKDPGYLSRQHIRILDGSGNTVNASSIDWSSQRATNYILRQDSGHVECARQHSHQHAEQIRGLHA